MSGYTPIFDTVLDGTLFGKWPHTGIWMCLLSQMDKHGNIDMNPNLLAAKIGVPVDLLKSCIADFMRPDPGSRTKESDGRRLELIDPDARDWGWHVVNFAKYREKARLKSKNESEVQTGRNRSRMDDRRSPPKTAADPLSDTNANTDTDANTTQSAPPAPGGEVKPEGQMAIALREIGVRCSSMDQTLQAWVRDGFTVQQAVDAVALARMRKPYPEPIPVNYLDPILRKPTPPPKPQADRVTWRPPPDEENSGVSERV